jgi:hypothetical protein
VAVNKAQEAIDAAASLSDATETIKGRARFATSAEGLAGTNNDSIMTPLKTKTLIDYMDMILHNTKAINRDFLIAGSTHTKIKIRKGTFIKCTLSNIDYKLKQLIDEEFDVISKLDTGTTLTAGKDYSIYLVENVANSNGLDFKVSLNGTYPTGYTADNSYKIGGFHTLCVAVTAENAPILVDTNIWATHPAIGYAAGDIIPNSVWTLLHRPISNPNGMAYVDKRNKWVDIYLQSGTLTNTTSAFGATTTDTRTQIQHEWDMALVNKELATDSDFIVFAEGSNQKTNISGSADAVTTGGHLDTAGKRMISGFFIEDCCGFLWQWLDEIAPVGGGTNWSTYGDGTTRGQNNGSMPYCLAAGGLWRDGASCGSRSRIGAYTRSRVSTEKGCRGGSLPLF